MTSLRPNLRLALLILAAALVLCVAAALGDMTLTGAACALLVVPVLWDAWALLVREPPRAQRPERVQAVIRHPFEVVLTLDASERVRLVALDFPHELGGPLPITPLSPAAHHELRQLAIPRRRGLHRLGPVWLWVESPLGLWSRRCVTQAPCAVTVWPDVRGPGRDVIGREVLDDGGNAARRPAQAGSELSGLEPFARGDDPRHVDWKATAKNGHPIVRRWHADRQRWVVVVIDAGRLMRAEHAGENKFDAAVRALVRVGLAARARGDRVGALVYGERVVRWIPPLSGPTQAEHLVRACAGVEPRGVESEPGCTLPQLLAVTRRALVIWVTDVLDAEGAERLTQAVIGVRARHLPVVALLRDPSLDEAFARAIDGPAAAYRRAAAELVAKERDRALERLRAHRIPALDLSMKNLALGVVKQYTTTRWRGSW